MLSEARTRALAPSSASSAPGWQDADLLRIANGEIPQMAKRIKSKKEGFFNVRRDVAFTAGTATYRNVTRAMGASLALVQLKTPEGVYQGLDKWNETDVSGIKPSNTGTPRAYLWRGNSLVFYPTPDSASYSYSLVYPRRPSKLVLPTTVGLALGNIGGLVLTLQDYTAATLGFTTSTALDFLQSEPPFDAVTDDATPTVVSGYDLTFAAGNIPTEMLPVAYGGTGKRYYVALSGEAPVLQMPAEAFYILAHRMAVELVSNDTDLWKKLNAELISMETDFYGSLADRDSDEPDHIACETWA